MIGANPAVRRVVKGSRSAGDEGSEEQYATHPDTVQLIRKTAGTKRGAEDDVMASPAKRAHTIPFPLTQVLLLSATGRGAMPVPRDAGRISTRCEEHVCQPDVVVVFDTAGEFREPQVIGKCCADIDVGAGRRTCLAACSRSAPTTR